VRLHFSTAQHNTTWERMLETWKVAEDIDVYEAGWTFDHFYPIFSDPTGDCMEGWIALTALLHETRRLRGGVLVTGMVYRHPAVLANMACTLDITSGGRLELGVGAGWNEEECDAYGIELGSLTDRFDRFEEGLAVIMGLLTQDRTTFEGRYYTLTEAMNSPKSVQRPHPPICVGGAGEKRTLPLVARYAQNWNYPGGDTGVEGYLRKRAVLDEACAAIGRDPSEIAASVFVRPGDSPAATAEDLAAYAEAGVAVGIVSTSSTGPAALEPLADAFRSTFS
jgi:F420-dependent oxidoreductase-like protein